MEFHLPLKMPGKERTELPLLREEPLIEAGALLKEETSSRLLAGGILLITGEIERKSSFEKAPPIGESPDIIVPTRCTGWKAMNQFSQEMAGQFVLNSMGTRIILEMGS